MKRISLCYISLILALLVVFSCLTALNVSAEETSATKATTDSNEPYTIDDTSDKNYTLVYININEQNSSEQVHKNIQDAFNIAKVNATYERQYKIILPDGTFRINTTLNIYSNTYLEMDGTTLLRDYSDSVSMLKAGTKNITATGYEGYGNITIHGGTFDGWDKQMTASTSNLVRFGHARNILIDSVTFTNDTSSHHLELGACKDVTITNCKFTDQHLKSGDTAEHESIQIDALNENCFPLYDSYDGTSCRDLTIKNCEFNNVTRGIGSHAVVLDDNSYFDNIKISDNTFTNIDGYAIVGLFWTNTFIENNTITNCKNGILMRCMRSDYQGIYNGNFSAPLEDYNITIKDNKINSLGLGIRLYGQNVTEAVNWTASSTGETHTIPKADYRLCGVTVTNNTINSTNYAIGAYHTYKSKISENTVTMTENAASTNAIILNDSSNNSVLNNTITSSAETLSKSAIVVTNSSLENKITTNTISGNFTNGIQIASSSNDCTINENSISDTGSNAITVSDSKNIKISGNTVNTTQGSGIVLKSGSSSPDINNNNVTASGGNAITVNASTVNKITNNTVDSNSCGIYSTDGVITNINNNSIKNSNYGIYSKNSTIDTLDSNTISLEKTYGIVLKNSQLQTTNDNAVTYSQSHGIYSSASSGTLTGNTISNSGKYGMYFDNNSTNKIYKNSFSNNTSGDIYLAGTSSAKITNLSTPSSFIGKNATYNKNTLSWKAVAGASEYQIYRSTDGTNFILHDTVKTNSYNDTKVTPGSKYYYKIMAIACTSKTTVYSSYSNTISIDTMGLGTVTDTSITQNNSSKITLKWSNSVVPQNYNIYRKTSDGSYALIASVNGSTTSFTDINFIPAKTYYYKIRPLTYYGTKATYGSYSTAIKIKPTVLNGSLTSAKAVSGNKATLTIKHTTGNKGYTIYTSSKKASGYKILNYISAATAQTGYTPKLPNGTKYIKIKSYRDVANIRYYSSYSNPIAVSVATVGKTSISSLKTSKQTATVKWTSAKNASGYEVSISTNGKSWKILTRTDSKTRSYKALKLTKGTKYKFRIRAFKTFCNEKYYGAYSTVKEIKVKK
ncbi:MAG: right-handed parallel beta-helix repeat-containing protein [Ruminococcus sp.]|nr:right-handed parallel beta-helix repeat-containing protein [Ruminococcus sp.]